MKILIPVEGKSLETNVNKSFGRAPYFLIYDTASAESIFLDNGAATSQGGAGIRAAQIVVDNNVGVLLTPRCGKNAAAVLSAADIELYKTINDTAENNIKAYVDGKLSKLDEIHAGFHNHGGN